MRDGRVQVPHHEVVGVCFWGGVGWEAIRRGRPQATITGWLSWLGWSHHRGVVHMGDTFHQAGASPPATRCPISSPGRAH